MVVVTLLMLWEGLFHWSQVAGNKTGTGVPWTHPSLDIGIINALLQWPFPWHNGTGTSRSEAAHEGTATSFLLSSAEGQKFLVQALEKMRWNGLSPIKTSPKTGRGTLICDWKKIMGKHSLPGQDPPSKEPWERLLGHRRAESSTCSSLLGC